MSVTAACRRAAVAAWREPVPVGSLALLTAAVIGVVADPLWLAGSGRLLSLALVAASVCLLAGWVGLPSLGQVAPYAAGAYTTALLARGGFTTAPLQLAAAVTAGAMIGWGMGVLLARTQGSVYLMASLALGELAGITAGQWEVTGGTDGLAGIPATTLPGMQLVGDRPVYLYTVTVTAVVVTLAWWAVRGWPARLLTGLREQQPRLAAYGHPTRDYLIAAHTAAGAIAGTGGSLLITADRYVSPADVGFDVAAIALLAVAAAGRHLIWAAVAIVIILSVRDWASTGAPGAGNLLLGLTFAAAAYLTGGGAPIRLRPHTSHPHTSRPAAAGSAPATRTRGWWRR